MRCSLNLVLIYDYIYPCLVLTLIDITNIFVFILKKFAILSVSLYRGYFRSIHLLDS